MTFFLGTHKTIWLARPEFVDVPLFVSHWQLKDRARMPQITTSTWALDSGGFTQLKRDPLGWPAHCEEPYVEAVYRYAEAGGLAWASQQDWMCEPWMLNGRTVKEHQERTVANFLTLKEMAPELPWLPVVQGWEQEEYHEAVELFASAGVDLVSYPTVGVGSVCRRQGSAQIEQIITSLAGLGLKLHGFGVKVRGLARYAHRLASSDSMAWSFDARYRPPLPDCSHGVHGTGKCNNCPRFALLWRAKVLKGINAMPEPEVCS